MPHLKAYQLGLWIAFFVSLPLGLYTNWIALGALLCGMSKKHGYPQFNKLYLQRVIFDENFQMIPYLGVTGMGGLNLAIYLPLFIHAYLEMSPMLKQFAEQRPSLPLASMIKEHTTNAVQHKQSFLEQKADIEVYIGIYLIIVWFFGWSNFFQILIYWQLIRVRYMVNSNTQAAFARVDRQIMTYMNHPSCPGIVKQLYIKIRGFLASMGDVEQQRQAAGSGGLGSMFSRCNIF